MATIWAHIQDPPPAPSAARPELPKGIDDVIARGMAKRPDERYATCRELVDAARQELGVSSGEISLPPAQPRRRFDWRLPAVLAAVLLLAAAVIVVLVVRGGGSGISSLPPNTVGAIDPKTNKLVAAIPVGHRPDLDRRRRRLDLGRKRRRRDRHANRRALAEGRRDARGVQRHAEVDRVRKRCSLGDNARRPPVPDRPGGQPQSRRFRFAGARATTRHSQKVRRRCRLRRGLAFDGRSGRGAARRPVLGPGGRRSRMTTASASWQSATERSGCRSRTVSPASTRPRTC